MYQMQTNNFNHVLQIHHFWKYQHRMFASDTGNDECISVRNYIFKVLANSKQEDLSIYNFVRLLRNVIS